MLVGTVKTLKLTLYCKQWHLDHMPNKHVLRDCLVSAAILRAGGKHKLMIPPILANRTESAGFFSGNKTTIYSSVQKIRYQRGCLGITK
jgi:hypothetical protein